MIAAASWQAHLGRARPAALQADRAVGLAFLAGSANGRLGDAAFRSEVVRWAGKAR